SAAYVFMRLPTHTRVRPRSILSISFFFFFFFNDTATTEIYTLSLHDALPIWWPLARSTLWPCPSASRSTTRSEEHTSELQSHSDLVCRLLLEKKKKKSVSVGEYSTGCTKSKVCGDTRLS